MTKIIVSIPTHNRVNYLKLAIESVLSQSYQDFNVVISDNSNNNDSKNYINSLGSNKIKYYQVKSDTSATNNQNNAATHGKSEFKTYLTDDDLLHKDYLRDMYTCIQVNGAKLVRAGGKYIDTSGHILTDFGKYPERMTAAEYVESRIKHEFVSGLAGYMFRTTSYNQVGGLCDMGFEGSLYADDYLWFKLAILEGQIFTAKSAIWYWRKHNNIVGRGVDFDKFAENVPKYIKNVLNILPIDVEYDEIRKFLNSKYAKDLIFNRAILEKKDGHKYLKNTYLYLKYYKYINWRN